MRKYIYFLLLIIGIISSCEKKENGNDEMINNDTIDKQDSNSIIDSIIIIYDNPYFPMDTNDIWIYSTTTYIYDDIDDSIVESYNKTIIDTVIPNKKKLIDKIYVQKFFNKYYNTQANKITLVIDSNRVYSKTLIIDILFTNKNDTNWTDTVPHEFYGESVIEFTQTRIINSDEIKLTTKQGYLIGLDDIIVFKKDIGIIESSYDAFNMDEYTKLKNYINN